MSTLQIPEQAFTTSMSLAWVPRSLSLFFGRRSWEACKLIVLCELSSLALTLYRQPWQDVAYLQYVVPDTPGARRRPKDFSVAMQSEASDLPYHRILFNLATMLRGYRWIWVEVQKMSVCRSRSRVHSSIHVHVRASDLLNVRSGRKGRRLCDGPDKESIHVTVILHQRGKL